jgi:class 3 adenylate cyclase/tetratricopeptide (TPR) repeat protein
VKCPKCQHFNDETAKFCAKCAAPLATTCMRCGHQLPREARFCPQCAQPISVSTSAQTSLPDRQDFVGQSPFGSPDTYTPRHLAQKILSSKAALEGERKQVTVLFADLKGSMELLAERDPEEARKLLAPVLEHMMEAVHHYEGTVNQVAGDGIMALFGAPLAHEDHAVRACYAALRMQEGVKRHAEDVFHAHGVKPQIRVGLNSGEVVVAAIGSDLRMDYTAIGRTTHLAARMEQLASPGSILLTPSTLRLVEGFVTVRTLGPVPVKGLTDALEVHELTGIGPAHTRFQAVARRGLTRFVGRDAELEQLRRVRQLACDGHGQVVALIAEAGVGKSRLIHELTHSHGLEGWLVLECGAVSYGKAMSYLPVVNLLKSYFEVEDRDSLEVISDKVAGKLLALDRALESTLPAFLTLLDVPVQDDAWQSLDPAQRRRRILDAVRHLLLRQARRQPLLLIFEDLHWIDGETQALLDGLVESLGSARILLLATHRPEYQHGWGGKTYCGQIRLDALPTETAGKLLDALLGVDPGLAPLKQLLVPLGNPFYLEEAVRTLVETKALKGLPGDYRLTRPVEAIQVPATVQVMLAARIDRLASEDKRLLQVAAVVGERAPFSLLRAIAELPDEALRSALAHLRATEFLYETGLPPDFEYTFKHALTHDVTYGSLLLESRRELHARIVAATETLHQDRLGEHTEQLAYHAVRGELRERAVRYLRQAGVKATARSALQHARDWFDQALGVLDALPESQSTLEEGFEIRLEQREALTALGELPRTLERLREAEALAERLNDDRRRGRVWAVLTSAHLMLGELDEALVSGYRALEIAGRLEDLRLRILTTMYLEQAHFFRGDYQRAVDLATDNLSVLHREFLGNSAPSSAYDRGWLSASLAQLGQITLAAEVGAEAIRLAEARQHPFFMHEAYLLASIVQTIKGDWANSLLLLNKGFKAIQTANAVLMTSTYVVRIGLVLARLGETKEALNHVRHGAELLAIESHVGLSGFQYVELGRACLTLGRLDEAQRFGERGVELLSGHLGGRAHALQLLGDIATHPERFDAERGEAHYRQALALAEPRGMRPVIAHCHLGLSKLYQRTGRREQASEHLTIATTMYREMDMSFWLERAEAETRELT